MQFILTSIQSIIKKVCRADLLEVIIIVVGRFVWNTQMETDQSFETPGI